LQLEQQQTTRQASCQSPTDKAKVFLDFKNLAHVADATRRKDVVVRIVAGSGARKHDVISFTLLDNGARLTRSASYTAVVL